MTTALLTTLVLAVGVQTSQSSPGGSDSSARVDLLLTGYQEWRSSIRFASTYEYYQFDADSWAFAGEPPNSPFASGEMHKDGALVRYSRILSSSPELVGIKKANGETVPDSNMENVKKGDQLLVRGRSWDSVYDDRMCLRYDIGWDRVFDTAVYTRRDEIVPKDGYPPCCEADRQMGPLNPFLGCFPGLPGQLPFLSSYTIVEESSDTIKLRATTGDGPNRVVLEVDMRTDLALPTIIRVRREHYEAGASTGGIEGRMSDWVVCDGLHVPRLVQSTLFGPGISTLVRYWRSNDLGDRDPVPEDFIIEIPTTTSIVGLRDAPRKGVVRKLGVAGVEDSAILLGEVSQLQSAEELLREKTAPRRRLVLWVSTGILLLVGIALSMNRKKEVGS